MSEETKTSPVRDALRISRGGFLAVGAFSFAINALMLTVPLYMLQVYDRVLTSGSMDTLIALTVLAVGLLVCHAMLEFVRSRILVRVGNRLDNALGGTLFAAVLRSRLASGDQSVTQSFRDMETVRGFLTSNGLTAFFDSPWTPAFLLLIFAFHPLLGAIALFGAVLLFSLAVIGELVSRGPMRKAGALSVASHRFAETSLRNAEVIEAMGMQDTLLQRWQMRHDEALAQQALANDRAGLLTAIAKFVRPVLQIAMLGVGAYLAVIQEITPGVMIAASIILGRALAPVEAAIGAWRGFVAARGAYHRVEQLLEEVGESEATLPLPRPSGRLSVEGVVAVPPGGKKPVLQNVSFQVAAGQILGVVGPSAAGKSSLARLIVGVWKPVAGHVRIDSADVWKWDKRELGQHMGYLPQDVELFDGTVAENIARFREPDAQAVVAAAKKAGVHELILRLPEGYDTRIGDGGSALSGGQRQRIGLARALYGDPALVVLDEPNASLDSEGEDALRKAIRSLGEQGCTVVFIAHHARVLNVCDLLLVMRDGRVDSFGPREEVMMRLARPAQPAGQPRQADQAKAPAKLAEQREGA